MTKEKKPFLYEELDVIKKYGGLKGIPVSITDNLAEHIGLREYQEEAFRHFITYYESDLSKNKQIQGAFQMATGSGKTVIMAGLILYLYQQGYRHFLFFVNQTTIVEKTKVNFIDHTSQKYLFADNILIDGLPVQIHSADTFADIPEDTDDIHIIFTSIQGLYNNIRNPRENVFSIDDFEDNKIVMLADENHHGNRSTKGDKDGQGNGIETWEDAVNAAFYANRDNVLLEFSATLGIETNKKLQDKYRDILAFNYNLAHFRESGYTKDFQNFISDRNHLEKALMACIMSEYRRHLFGDLKLNQKPVVMLKSKRISDSEEFYEEFFKKIAVLEVSDLEGLYGVNQPLNNALNYFKEKGDGTLINLVAFLKGEFTEERSLVVNSKTNLEDYQVSVNSLESPDNPYRLIFAVDMLNEGWDVLNLYDIVRLYDTRQGSGVAGKVGAYTIKEAQLIGRGARYNPYQVNDDQPRDQRKYDDDILNPYRILETMYFHSMSDSRYIAELRDALKRIGLEPDERIERTYELKDKFKETNLYKNGVIYSNERRKKDRRLIRGLEGSQKTKAHTYTQPNKVGAVLDLFGDNKAERRALQSVTMKFNEVPYRILEGASMRYPDLGFSSIKTKYPNVSTLNEFLTSEEYLGNRTITIRYEDSYSGRDLYVALIAALADVARFITQFKDDYEGTKIFTPKPFRNVVRDKTIQMEKIVEGGKGDSQNDSAFEDRQLDLSREDWYVFNDNYGTDEEKYFIRYFNDEIKDRLEEKGVEYYVVRNERFSQFAIYSFENGERFEPDFVLFVKQAMHKDVHHQVFIEPKGLSLLEIDKWKEDFLLELEDNYEIGSKPYFAQEFNILGFPFYNNTYRKDEFEKAIIEWIEKL